MKSGFQQLLSYERVKWEKNLAQMDMDVHSRHLNLGNAVHGGALATLLDDTMGYAGVFPEDGIVTQNAITLSMTVSYLGPGITGRVSCKARWLGGGRRIFFARGEVYTEAGNLVATGEGTYKIVPLERMQA